MRSDAHMWLLDFKQARTYGGLTAIATSSRTIPERIRFPARSEPDAMLAVSEKGYGEQAPFDPDDLAHSFDADATAPSYLALRAEFCIANQAWGYAAGMLEEMSSPARIRRACSAHQPATGFTLPNHGRTAQPARTICNRALQSLIRRLTPPRA